MPRTAALLVVLAALALPAAAGAAEPTLTQVGTFAAPTHVTAPPGDVRRLLVTERGGTVRLVVDGRVEPAPWLDLRPRVLNDGGERGLFAVVPAPDFAASGRVYALYTRRPDGAVQLDELRAGSSAAVRSLLTIPHPRDNHNGGGLAFGPDGLLYVGVGDGGGGGDPDRNAQNPFTRLGKVLRLDVNGPDPAPQTFALGLRNPWRLSFDRATGDLTVADVGQDAFEEIDLVARSALAPGVNFGWPRFEGDAVFDAGAPLAGFPTPPVLTHAHSADWCSITGGQVVRDPALPELAGRYVYGDFCLGQLYAADLATRTTRPLGLRVEALTSVGEDGCGRLYATSLAGPLLRLGTTGACAATAPPAPPAAPSPAATAPRPVRDRRPPVVRLRAAGRQRLLRTPRVVVRVSCSERCTLRVGGRVAGRSTRTVRRTLPPRRTARIRLGLTSGTRRAVGRTLARGRRATATLTVVARDRAGNRAVRRARVRVTR